MADITNIFQKTLNKLGIGIVKRFPRHSTRFAKKYFRGKSLEAGEVGVWKGENSRNLLENLNVKKIYLIDSYEDHTEYSKTEPSKNKKILKDAEKRAKALLKKYAKKIIWIKEYSDSAVSNIPELDFIYIDGDHSYKQSKTDMINYWKKVRKGGILAGHDICANFDNHGVARAFVEFCSKYKLKPYISRTDWWVVKE